MVLKTQERTVEHGAPASLLAAGLAALGIVYGDIGTSPLYAFKIAAETVAGGGPIGTDPAPVLVVLSLILWSLLIVVALKYVVFVMRADNHGEGGILALLALTRTAVTASGSQRLLVALGIFGATLLYADGTITPAISVLSAVEGLEVVTPVFTPWVSYTYKCERGHAGNRFHSHRCDSITDVDATTPHFNRYKSEQSPKLSRHYCQKQL